jgi:hypothetical protein
MIDFSYKPVKGFDKELLLVGEGFVSRPVTLSKNTIPGLTPDDDGHYVIPQGTFLYGANGNSLLVDPQQEAVAVIPTVTKATVTLNSIITFTATDEGNVTYTVGFTSNSTGADPLTVTVDASHNLTVNLETDSSGTVLSTYDDVVKAVNNDIVANTYFKASIASGADGTTVAQDETDTPLAGGGNTTVSSDIDGILYHSTIVDDGEATAAMIIHGYIDADKMPDGMPGSAVKAKLPHIVFGRKD